MVLRLIDVGCYIGWLFPCAVQIVWHYSWGDGDKPLFTSDRGEPIINQRKKAIKAQLGKAMNFTAITLRNTPGVIGKKWLKDSYFVKIPPQHG